jgi:hypothetical protein
MEYDKINQDLLLEFLRDARIGIFTNSLEDLEYNDRNDPYDPLHSKIFSLQFRLEWLYWRLIKDKNPIFGAVLMKYLQDHPDRIPALAIEITTESILSNPKKLERQAREYHLAWKRFSLSTAICWIHTANQIPLNECYKKVATWAYDCLDIKISARTLKDHYYLEMRNNPVLMQMRRIMEGTNDLSHLRGFERELESFPKRFPEIYKDFLVAGLDY